MNAKITVTCYRSKILSNGEAPLMVKITKNGKRSLKTRGISLNPRYWDFEREKPKGNDGLVVDVDAYDGISSKSLGTLHHFHHGGVLGFGKSLLISACTTTYDVADASKQILEHVGTDNGFTCHKTLVLADGMTFNLWGSLQSKASPSSPSG